MARALVRLLPFEMAMLGLLELGLLFALILMLLTAGGPALLLSSTDLPHDCMVLAAMLALTIAGNGRDDRVIPAGSLSRPRALPADRHDHRAGGVSRRSCWSAVPIA